MTTSKQTSKTSECVNKLTYSPAMSVSTDLSPVPSQSELEEQADIRENLPLSSVLENRPISSEQALVLPDYVVEGDDEETDDENELVVLDPAHPLMQRVQAALKEQLSRQNEKLEIEVREKNETLKSLETEREGLGVELYGIQQQLARQQMILEQEQDTLSGLNQLRQQKERTLDNVRQLYRKMQDQLKKERQQTLELRHNVESTTSRLRYLDEAHSTIKDDIALTKRVTEKATSDVSKAQKDKLQQDMYVEHLTSELHNLEEHLGLARAQCTAQAQETKAIKEILTDATMELEAVLLEKKKLVQQWNSALVGMRRRDDAYAGMLSALHAQQQQVRSLETEIDNYKKSIINEQERNEQLTMRLNKLSADIEHIKKQIESSMIKKEALKMEYMTYTRALQETEQSLAKANTDCILKQSEIESIRTQTEREALEKNKLEDAVMEKMMQRLTMDKATQYTQKSIKAIRKKAKDYEIMVANVENEISQTRLQLSHVTSQLRRLQQSLDEHNAATQENNKLISKAEAEITKNNALIERKQTQIDQLNKKIEQKLSKSEGGEDLGPLEVKIEGIQKQIDESVDRCAQMQQFWLRQQNELVKKTQQSDNQAQSVDSLKKQLLILDQKKLRTDAMLDHEEKEQSRVDREIGSLQKDMVRLSTLITEKRGQQERLTHGNILSENDFINALKEAELESIQIQSNIEQLQEEKERLLNSLVESERQIMLWEKKIQVTREMKEAVDSEAGQAEVKAMKAEIHRMQVRHDQLLRQQEKMIQDMERAVYRREAITFKGEAQTKAGKKDQTQGHLKKKILDLQRQIKQTAQETSKCENRAHELQSTQRSIADELEERKANCQERRSTLEGLQAQVMYAEEKKKQNMRELVSSQTKVKYMNSAKDGKYKLFSKTKEGREGEWQRQQEKLRSLHAILERLESDFPTCRGQLRNMSTSIKSRLSQNSGSIHKETEVA